MNYCKTTVNQFAVYQKSCSIGRKIFKINIRGHQPKKGWVPLDYRIQLKHFISCAVLKKTSKLTGGRVFIFSQVFLKKWFKSYQKKLIGNFCCLCPICYAKLKNWQDEGIVKHSGNLVQLLIKSCRSEV